MTAPARVPWLAFACLAASMALVGSYVGLSKWLVAVFPIFLLAWLRFGIAAVAMLPWLARPPGEPRLSRHDRRLLFLESFFGNFLFSLCMLYGISLGSALAAGVIMAGLPAAVALLSRLFLGERIAPRTGAGIGCAVAGIALVSVSKSGTDGGGQSLAGSVLLVGALLCEAAYVVIGKRLTGRVGPKRISALINLWGFALVTPLGVWQATRFDFAAVPAASWTLLVGYAVAASIVTVWLWMTGLKQVPASSAGVFTVLLPISAAAVGIVFLGERFSTAQAGAFALAVVGLLLASWVPRGPVTRPVPPRTDVPHG